MRGFVSLKRTNVNIDTFVSCCYTNSDMLANKMDELNTYIKEHKPAIIGIAEVKPKHTRYAPSLSIYNLEDYTAFHKNVDNKKGRGVILYVHKSLQVNEVSIQCEFEEYVCAEINLREGDKLLTCVIYRSDSGSEQNNDNLNRLMRLISNMKYSHKLVMDDFNYRNINWSSWTTPSSQASSDHKFVESVRDSFLYQHVLEPTRCRVGHKPSTIDLIFTNESEMINTIEYMSPLGKSDHSILKFDYNCYTSHGSNQKPRYRYDKGDYTMIKDYLTRDWELEFNEVQQDCEQQWNILLKHIEFAKELYIPTRSGPPKWRTKGVTPLDMKCIEQIKRKRRCWQRYIETREDSKWREYCKARNKVKKMTRQVRRNIERDIAKQAKTNPKRFWSYVKSKTKTRQGISQLQIPNNNTMTENDTEKAEVLLSHFSSVFTKEPVGPIPGPKTQKYDVPLNTMHITEEQILKKLRKIQTAKSPGPDQMHPKLIKELADVLAKPLSIIFNTSLQTRTLPASWKTANVSAIFKKGDNTNANNYRPISLTSIICRIMESIIREEVIEHMKKHNLFSDKQYGFISGRSTSLQLLKVLDLWTQILDNGGQIDIIYMDFMKAFDQVPHRRLVGKIESYGIGGDIIGWISDFLRDRTQRVLVNGFPSSVGHVTSGIPQGSVLGPLLFVLYINDLPDAVDSYAYLFADDTKLFSEITNRNDMEILQQDLDKLQDWSSNWLLNFHPDKCKLLTIGTRALDSGYHLVASGVKHDLECVTNMKDLGVVIDSSLNFEIHMQEKINKANQTMGMIRRAFTFLDEDIFVCLFKAFVRPQLEYANAVWNPHKAKDINAVENVQRRATKLIPSLTTMTYTERLQKLKLPTLVYRRTRGDMIETYKILNNYNEDIMPIIKLNRSATRGNSLKMLKSRPKRDIRKFSFTNRIVNIWNKLPDEVVNARNMLSFEKQLDKFWANSEFKYDFKAPLP